jgi:uncharacterized protein (DUF1015 family)
MPLIRPFRGIRYNPDNISFISRVIAPPYDIIGPDDEQQLLQRDQHNIVRITLGKTPAEGRPEGAYEKAAYFFEHWMDKGVLTRDDEPSIYIVEQSFEYLNTVYRRMGFIAALRLEPHGENSSIHPHERTMDTPKSDRLKLMSACKANLSQPMLMYSDPDGEIDRLLQHIPNQEFLYSFSDNHDVGYRIYRTADASFIDQLASLIGGQNMVIADGHHRYESALNYKRKHRNPNIPEGEAPEDFLSTLCISVSSPALLSLPTHRCVIKNTNYNEDEFLDSLSSFFELTPISINSTEAIQEAYEEAKTDPSQFACILDKGRFFLLSLKSDGIPDFSPHKKEDTVWSKMPVCILHYLIFDKILSIEPGSKQESDGVEYITSATDAYWMVQKGAADLAFILPGTDPRMVQDLSSRGLRLPVKSTYFYPKIPSGLIIYPYFR